MSSDQELGVEGTTRWERLVDLAVSWTPWFFMVFSWGVVLVAPRSDRPWALLAAVSTLALGWSWVLVLRPFRRGAPSAGRVLVYFAGFVVLAVALVWLDPVFAFYAVTGFFHAGLLRPMWLIVFGVGATSLIVNASIVRFGGDAESWGVFVLIVAVQTVAITAGVVSGERIVEISRKRRLLVDELRAALDENQRLHGEIVEQAREAGIRDERHRLAGEIHDTVAQGLTAVITQLEAAHHAKDQPEELERHLRAALELSRESLTEARRSVGALGPTVLSAGSFVEAIENVVDRWSERSRLPARLVVTGDVAILCDAAELALFRATQEGLANVARHAQATRVGVTISYLDDVVVLDIRDDGSGFDPSTVGGGGFGLDAMRRRVEHLGGELTVETAPGRGTALSLTLPISEHA